MAEILKLYAWSASPACYAEIEAALVLFATLVEPAELRRVLRRIAHPAAGRAGELLAHGTPAGAEAVLEDACRVPPTKSLLSLVRGLPRGDQAGTGPTIRMTDKAGVGNAERA